MSRTPLPRDPVVCGYVRTPIGAFQGALASMSAPRIAAAAIDALLARTGVPSAMIAPEIDECILGCVLQGGIGQAPARQAARYAGLPDSVRAVTINKVCGSGAKAISLAAQAIIAGDADLVVAGGMESMSQAPYALDKARAGYRMGNGTITDLMIHDGLWDPYRGAHMGHFGDLCAREKDVTRADLDAFAAESFRRAGRAITEGRFRDEVTPIDVPQPKGDPVRFDTDEGPSKVSYERIPKLKPIFNPDGTVTAANASQINDGAAVLLIAARDTAQRLGLPVLARVAAWAEFAQAPEWFTTAPVGAVQKLLARTHLGVTDIDRWEINEAFAVVALIAARELGIENSAALNPNGGAIALGHPIGASGARLGVTLISELRRTGGRLGVEALCIGGGEGIALLYEIEGA